MRTDHWIRAAIKEAAMLDGVRDAGEGLMAGADPSGASLARLALEAEKDQASQKTHRGLAAVGVAGGALGGAVLVPSMMSALYGGIMGLQSGRGVRGKAVEGVTQAAKGVWGRLSGVPKGQRAKSLIRQAGSTSTPIPLDDKDRTALKWLADRAPISSMEGHPVPAFPSMSSLSPEQARILEGPAQSALSSLVTQTSVGGILGGMGAYGAYKRGRRTGVEMNDALATPVPRKRR